MGPEATVELMQQVIDATPTTDDADHIRMLVDNNPKVPSRTEARMDGTGESPAPCMIDMARGLEEQGAECLVVVCTELSVIGDRLRTSLPVYDASELLAKTIVREVAG